MGGAACCMNNITKIAQYKLCCIPFKNIILINFPFDLWTIGLAEAELNNTMN